jgi:hypothetical protein
MVDRGLLLHQPGGFGVETAQETGVGSHLGLRDTQDIKCKLHRIIFQSRDKSIKGAGAYPYPQMLFFHEVSHQGKG